MHTARADYRNADDLTALAARRLHRLGLIEGRKPHRTITQQVASATGTLADYVRTRPQAKTHYETLICDFIRAQGHASRKDLDKLLLPLLSGALDATQKRNKISNLIADMRRNGKLHNRGTRTDPRWELK